MKNPCCCLIFTSQFWFWLYRSRHSQKVSIFNKGSYSQSSYYNPNHKYFNISSHSKWLHFISSVSSERWSQHIFINRHSFIGLTPSSKIFLVVVFLFVCLLFFCSFTVFNLDSAELNSLCHVCKHFTKLWAMFPDLNYLSMFSGALSSPQISKGLLGNPQPLKSVSLVSRWLSNPKDHSSAFLIWLATRHILACSPGLSTVSIRWFPDEGNWKHFLESSHCGWSKVSDMSKVP